MGEAKRRQKSKPSPDSPFFVLNPEEASRRLMDGDRSEMYLPVSEFAAWAKLSPEEFRREAAAGRLRVFGIRRGPDTYSDLCITAENAIEWLVWRRMAN